MKKKQQSLYALAFGGIFIAGFIFFYIVPFLNSVIMTFFSGITGEFEGMRNYINVFSGASFKLAAANTFKFIVVAVPLNMVLAFFIALSLQKLIGKNRIFRALFVLPLVVPALSVAIAFELIFNQGGIVNTLMGQNINFLNSQYSFVLLVIVYIWKSIGYNLILFMASLNMIPQSLLEAARLDGAKNLRMTISIRIPLIVPTVKFAFIMSIINVFKSFRESYEIFGAAPHNSIYMLQHYINNNINNMDYVQITIASITIVLVMLLIVIWLFAGRKGDVVSYEE